MTRPRCLSINMQAAPDADRHRTSMLQVTLHPTSPPQQGLFTRLCTSEIGANLCQTLYHTFVILPGSHCEGCQNRMLSKQHLLVLLLVKMLQHHLLQCGLALLDRRNNASNLLQVALHALHVAPNLL